MFHSFVTWHWCTICSRCCPTKQKAQETDCDDCTIYSEAWTEVCDNKKEKALTNSILFCKISRLLFKILSLFVFSNDNKLHTEMYCPFKMNSFGMLKDNQVIMWPSAEVPLYICEQ